MINNRNHRQVKGFREARGLHGACSLLSFFIFHSSFFLFHLSFFILPFIPLTLSAQIIGGNVYGGGNSGDVAGNASVTVKAGNLKKVFGGARMANVGGRTFVHIDGKEATDSMVINFVFGGNDIAGTIGTDAVLPAELTEVGTGEGQNNIDNTWNAFVRISTETDAEGKEVEDAKKVYIGQLFAGGNGEYNLLQPGEPKLASGDPDPAKTTYRIYDKKDVNYETPIAENSTGFVPPELDKSYLEVCGGSIVYAYGGGNNATVKENTVICVDNPSKVVNSILDEDGNELLTDARFKEMGINTGFSYPSSDAFQIGRFFGGNNEAEMAIRPQWNLKSGKIRNLYSGGNRGAMTHKEGLLLEIPETSKIVVDNVFGGCRMADVHPLISGTLKSGEYKESTSKEIQLHDADGNQLYSFPEGLAARVLVRGGDINNVYGGNDVTGKVYGGNAVGIYTTIRGDVYGGGNGSYPYTDNPDLANDDVYGDLYYRYPDPAYASTVDALNAFRPNAEQVSVRLKGQEGKPTIIHGSVFVGGNSASIATDKEDPMVHLKIGSHVIADNVFLGNNGASMVTTNKKDENHHVEGVLRTFASTDKTSDGTKFNTMDLTDGPTFASYMDGVSMGLKPDLVFDKTPANGGTDPADYIPYTSYIGSFFCGGNVGSMTYPDKHAFDFKTPVVLYNKFVGGCNNADVPESEFNAQYYGGLLGSKEEQAEDGFMEANGMMKDRLEITFNGVKMEPKRWNAAGTALEWNTAHWDYGVGDFVNIAANEGELEDRRLLGGNVYGGCYSSGHINGNVILNIDNDLIVRDEVFGTGDGESNVDQEAQGDDVMTVAMTVFGAGMGEDTEIWGSTTVNLHDGYCFQIFGGGEEGVVGKKNSDGEYEYNPAYSCTVNMDGHNPGYSEEEEGPVLAETEYIYGGGNEGDVCGDTYVNLGNGRLWDAFGGASNANIYGAAELYIGTNGGFPWVRDNVYGGNDFGGTILGTRNHANATTRPVTDPQLLESSTFVKYIQGRVDSIFGGNYGNYDYRDAIFNDYTDEEGKPVEGFSFPHLDHSSFVLFQPAAHSNNQVGYIFGSSEGYPGDWDMNNAMQEQSYVLIDDTQNKDNRFAHTDIYGGGAFSGVGVYGQPGAGQTMVDLFAGRVGNVYGGCNREGLIGYTRVNVPETSTVHANAIFGGGKGYDLLGENDVHSAYCDHYLTCVDYRSENAKVEDAIYGGNQNSRISCDTYLNIQAPVKDGDGNLVRVFGAGYGAKTVSGRTNVFLNDGGAVQEVYGGGRDGNAFNFATLRKWLRQQYVDGGSATPDDDVTGYGLILSQFATYIATHPISLPSNIGTYTNASGVYDGKYTNDIMTNPSYHNTNVRIMAGGQVKGNPRPSGGTSGGYAYAGGLGSNAVVGGTTYLELKGGLVEKDIYGGGTEGSVFDEYRLAKDDDPNNDFTAGSYVYIEGGMARNVYGGGWAGNIGYHEGALGDSQAYDIPGETHVTIGKLDGTDFINGIPAIQRNVYAGGEGGSVYGTANLTINNGYIGYVHLNANETLDSQSKIVPAGPSDTFEDRYVPKLDDDTWFSKDESGTPTWTGANKLKDYGNAFGSGYDDVSSVDNSIVNVYGGVTRGSVFGGGEIAIIGRGSKASHNDPVQIFKAGKTRVSLYDGTVLGNVFGGGRGYNPNGYGGALHTAGYTFGQTDVRIYGGVVGSEEAMLAAGDQTSKPGNVFGGGDQGLVFSAFTYPDGSLGMGKKAGNRYDDGDEGYYYMSNGTKFTDDNGTVLGDGAEKFMTEDCHVLVEPHCRVLTPFTFDNHPYGEGEYVPTSVLNKFKNKNADAALWARLDTKGIIIHNAVFAGGNNASGGSLIANDYTVYGNATASIHDAYHRDLITVGTGHTGGLYGDGNLTLVDGYRGLNITNYGTDFYNIQDEITIEDYHNLTEREAAYYELKFKCVKACEDIDGTKYTVGSTIPQDEFLALFANTDIINPDGSPNEEYWEENGVVSRYAGRIMNTIQRADFCGVWGSRMVMRGAEDRRITLSGINYTINRVREVSLNAKISQAGDPVNSDAYKHGNYFGIYSNVNYLGALTSDVDFYGDVRVTDNIDATTYKADYTLNNHTYHYGDADATWASWKEKHHNDRTRNNGTSHNKVALASGVYLELTSEESTGTGLREKDWGLITGVVELDLINVQKGIGGGFVYAKNQHGKRQASGKTRVTLTDLNQGAVTNKAWTYTEPDPSKEEWETSGNFVHSTQTIIDDCYDIGGRYLGELAVPAHYWFIKGQVYIYDQYLSAYTGAPNAYSQQVNIPLTITAASHGTMKLLNVKPNRYAYYSTYNANTQKKLNDGQKLLINDVTYYLNDPISYWDWYLLSPSERNLFVPQTYVSIAPCKIGDTEYPEGTVLLPDEVTALRETAPQKALHGEGSEAVPSVFHVEQNKDVEFDYVFRSSNNLSHENGYVLTYDINNPAVWNKYYTPITGSSQDDKINTAEYEKLTKAAQDNYYDGPTFRPLTNGLYGQRDYVVGDVIPEDVQTTYLSAKGKLGTTPLDNQASFEPAYMVTEYVETNNKVGQELHYQEGARLAKSEFTDAQWAALTGSVAAAYISKNTIVLSDADYIYNGQLLTQDEINAYKHDYPTSISEMDKYIVPAYYCTSGGLYGGDYFETTKNYRALNAWCSLSDADREHFEYNYDAFDVFADSSYGRSEGQKYQYDGKGFTTAEQAATNKAGYSLITPVDYTATYNGASDATPHNGVTLVHGKEYDRVEFEKLPNEQHHYAPIIVTEAGTYYVVNSPFIVGDTPYVVGTTITADAYETLSDENQEKISKFHFTDEDFIHGDGSIYYFCRESYTIGESGEGVGLTSNRGVAGTYDVGDIVPVGVVLDENTYRQLVNRQLNFTIHGVAPVETSTLYVSRNSDIFDLSKDKVVTVIYQYDYEESDESGTHITPVSERHVLNIHLQFKSGIPTVDAISQPSTVLPGNSLTLRVPTVTPGAYEVLGGGWEIFEKETDAESHTNGKEYTPNADSLYWYQDGYFIAYYAKTYLGKTFSNHVPVSVANYHDLKSILDDKKHHLHVDYDVSRLKRESKVYVNDYSSKNQNGLDLLKDFYDLSLITKSTPGLTFAGDTITTAGHPLKGHHLMNSHVQGGGDLEFFLRTDLDHSGSTWTSLGSGADPCFAGNLHGDGHTVSGLDNSLFGKLCGNVYNLGVTGSFTSAGVADTGSGYVENCWIGTTGEPDGSVYAVFGNPTAEGSIKQVVNSYYPSNKAYKTTASNHGVAIAKSEQAFYNGEVAFDLNGFYLFKRYSDKKVTSGTAYQYFDATNGTLNGPIEQHYGSNPALCSSGFNGITYVEDRYADGDFIYADGTVPSSVDERLYIDETTGDISYYPIWPDDYLFFGQKLTYGYSASQAHQSLPSAIVKDSGRLLQNSQSNRVYRAPAYYGNSTRGMVHFNPWAYLAAQSADGTTAAYPGMTAIDFKGYQDADYAMGTNGTTFYPPLLDDGGLVGIVNQGETQNLLVYAGDNETTNNVLQQYFVDPSYNAYSDNNTAADAQYDDGKKYGRVALAPSASVYGHLVQMVKNEMTNNYEWKALNDHFLVDKQDYNAPFAYSFLNPNANGDGGTRMWYQRQPDNYVDRSKGWEGVSLPFAASTVSASKNGEITHFYQDNNFGHEYWLREFKGIQAGGGDDAVKARMESPEKAAGSKLFTNTFLWDYYYSQNESVDKSGDKYQTYYKTSHTFNNYPSAKAATPYIVGFPGATYYEFDLSGDWTPSNTARDATWSSSNRKQTITFASPEGAAIGVSDNEMTGVTKNGYTFRPSYANMTFAPGTSNVFTMSDDGDSYEKVPAAGAGVEAVKVAAFRPYFMAAGGGDVKGTRSIVFTSVNDGRIEPQETSGEGTLIVRGRKHNIVVTSLKSEPTVVTIVNAAGMTITTYEIQPGETIETNVISGVYIVNQQKIAIE